MQKKILLLFLCVNIICCTDSRKIGHRKECTVFLQNLSVLENLKNGKKTNIDSIYIAVQYLASKTGLSPHIDINHTNPYTDTNFLNYDYSIWKKWYDKNKRKL
ncbi:MAG: hypothetical protein QM791_22465 [Ferruginibacter sp.]